MVMGGEGHRGARSRNTPGEHTIKYDGSDRADWVMGRTRCLGRGSEPGHRAQTPISPGEGMCDDLIFKLEGIGVGAVGTGICEEEDCRY